MTVNIDKTRGPELITASGRIVYPYSPRAEDLNLRDAMVQLAYTNRFNGALGALNVLGHSVNAARMAEHLRDTGVCNASPEVALLHDLPEYILGDITRPVKAGVGNAYREAEVIWGRDVYTKYLPAGALSRLTSGEDSFIGVVDNGCLYLELRDAGRLETFDVDFAPFDSESLGDFYYLRFTPEEAMRAFERRAREYGLQHLDELRVS